MPKRVHELAKELGVTSKEVVARGAELGIDLAGHLASLSDADATTIAASFPGARQDGAAPGEAPEEWGHEEGGHEEGGHEEVGHIVWFDKSSGQGEVEFPVSQGATRNMPFDLRRTRLEDSRYVSIEQGLEVSVTVDESSIKSIRSRDSHVT